MGSESDRAEAMVPGLVSVVIPSYNRARSCGRAVESALAQGCPVEVLVVDDGSTDDTERRIASYGKSVRYIRQANAGVACARNTGLAAARGEFVAFLDSDDAWLPGKLRAQLAVLKRWPEAGLVWTDMKAVDAQGRLLHERYLRLMYTAYKSFDPRNGFADRAPLSTVWTDCPPQWREAACTVGQLFPWMFMGNLVHTSTVMLRRSLQQEIGGFDPQLQPSGEDYDFHLRASRRTPAAYIDVPLVSYCIGAHDQLSARRYWADMARSNLRTVEACYEREGGAIALPRNLVLRRLSEAHLELGVLDIFNEPRRARRNFLDSLSWRPNERALRYLCMSVFPRRVLLMAWSAKRRLRTGALRALGAMRRLGGRKWPSADAADGDGRKT